MRFVSLIILTLMTHIAYSQNAVWIVLPEYDQITAFSEGVAAVMQGGKWGYINQDGNIVAECKYDKVYPFSEGVGVATSFDNAIVAIIDRNGSTISELKDASGQVRSYQVDPRFALFGDGLLLVTDSSTEQLYDRRRYKKWGYLNQSGILQIDIKYFGALPFCEGLAGVAYSNLKYAYITPGGAVAITNDFNRGITIGAMGFYQGSSIVVDEKGLSSIDSRGRKASGSLAKFTPLENFYNTTSNFIRGEEGNLEFDQRGRVTHLVNINGERTPIRSELESSTPFSVVGIQRGAALPNDLSIEQALAAQIDGKIGLVMLSDDSALRVDLRDSLVEAAPETTSTNIQFNIENSISRALKGLDIYCNGDLVASNIDIATSGGAFEVEVPNPINVETDDVALNIRIENRGLELLNQSYSATINNPPVLVEEPEIEDVQPVPIESVSRPLERVATQAPSAVKQVETTTTSTTQTTPQASQIQTQTQTQTQTQSKKTEFGGFIK